MQIYIIDCRNLYLESLACKSNNQDKIISLMLSEDSSILALEISDALRLYCKHTEAATTKILIAA